MGHHGELSKDWNKLVTPDNLLPLAYGRRWSIHGGHERRPRWKFTAISRCAAAGTTSGTTWSLGVQFARQSDGPARAEAIFEPPTPGVVAGEGSGQAWSVRLHAAQPQGSHDVHAFFPAEMDVTRSRGRVASSQTATKLTPTFRAFPEALGDVSHRVSCVLMFWPPTLVRSSFWFACSWCALCSYRGAAWPYQADSEELGPKRFSELSSSCRGRSWYDAVR